ncbi:MAG: T9SS type A sorting domain-containing protein [Candidatus Limisoma sp.]
MKKTVLFLLAILTAIYSYASTIKFIIPSGDGWESNYEVVYIYQNGIQNDYHSMYPSKANASSVSFDLPNGDYSYTTSMGHSGSITMPQSSITLPTVRVAFKIVDANGNRAEGNLITVNIYRNGKELKSRSDESLVKFNLAPNDNYAYKCWLGYESNGQLISSGYLKDLLEDDKDLEVTINIASLNVIAKYGNYPIQDKFTVINANGITSNLTLNTSSTSGKLVVPILQGNSCYLINDLGIKTGPYTQSTEPYFLEYSKVTFVSNTTTHPNILRTLSVSAAGGNSSKSGITDGKGKAIFYLLPGEYTWQHSGGSGHFVVTSSEQTINIKSNNKTLRFIHNNNPVADLHVNIDDSDYTTDLNGEVNIISSGDKAKVKVNGLGSTNVNLDQQTVSVQVFELSSTGPAEYNEVYSVYDSNYKQINFIPGTHTYILPGIYSIRNTSQSYEFMLDKDLCLNLNRYTLKLHIHDSDGRPVSNFRIKVQRNNGNILTGETDEYGNIEFVLFQNSEYKICDLDYAGKFVSFTADFNEPQNIDISIPSEIEFTVLDNNKPYAGTAFWRWLDNSVSSLNIINGVAKVRIDANQEGYLSLNGYSTINVPFTVYDGMKLNFVDVTIESKGKGITVPDYQPLFYKYKIIEGSRIELKAIPTQYGQFNKWIINNNEYTEDVIQYTVTASGIEAIAEFSSKDMGDVPYNSIEESFAWNISPNPTRDILNFSETINAKVSIYNMAGIRMKYLRVVSNSINVSDLPPGNYIIIAECTDDSQRVLKSKFIKE